MTVDSTSRANRASAGTRCPAGDAVCGRRAIEVGATAYCCQQWAQVLRSDRHDFRLVVGESCDRGLADVEMLGNHRRRRTGDPVRQRDVGEVGASEHFEELQVGVARVLDVMPEVLLDVADVARVEVHGDGVGAGVEHRHLPFALDPVLPFIGVGVPVHLAQSTRAYRYECGGAPFPLTACWGAARSPGSLPWKM